MCAHVQCGWDVLVICTNDYLTETGWELGRGEGGAVWEKLWGARESCVCRGGGGGELCVGAVLQKLRGELCFIHVSDPFTEVFNMLLCGMFK